jgi:hypothetical protein
MYILSCTVNEHMQPEFHRIIQIRSDIRFLPFLHSMFSDFFNIYDVPDLIHIKTSK